MGPPADAEVTSHVVALTKSPLGSAVSFLTPSSSRALRNYGYAAVGARFVARSGTLFWYEWIRVFCGTARRYVTLRVRAFLEYVAMLVPKFARASGPPRGSRGYAPHGYMGLMAGHAACCTHYTRCCPFWFLYSCSPWSSRPQPLRSGGDVAPCEDRKGHHELSL